MSALILPSWQLVVLRGPAVWSLDRKIFPLRRHYRYWRASGNAPKPANPLDARFPLKAWGDKLGGYAMGLCTESFNPG